MYGYEYGVRAHYSFEVSCFLVVCDQRVLQPAFHPMHLWLGFTLGATVTRRLSPSGAGAIPSSKWYQTTHTPATRACVSGALTLFLCAVGRVQWGRGVVVFASSPLLVRTPRVSPHVAVAITHVCHDCPQCFSPVPTGYRGPPLGPVGRSHGTSSMV